jgi:alkylhydroperoxidase family enzyme
VTGCGICKNLRFAGAREAGLEESHVARIDDAYAASDLPARWKLAIRLADVLIHDPARAVEFRAELLAEFTPAELVELVATVTTAIAFSKAAVAFGAPREIPVAVVSTPAVEP